MITIQNQQIQRRGSTYQGGKNNMLLNITIN